MSEAPERIWVKESHDSWGRYGHWYSDSKGGGVEYVRADHIEGLEAKLRSMALDYLASEGQAQEAYQAQLELEAKLDKAMKLIEYAIELGRWDLNPSLRDDLIDFSAELKGETDE